MNEKDAGVVGKRLATSAMIAAIGFSVAAMIAASGVLLGQL